MFTPKTTTLPTKNGSMRLITWFGNTRLLAQDHTEQSGTYMNGVWKTACKKLKNKEACTSFGFLGVGTGGGIKIMAQACSHAHITAIDWEESLIAHTQKSWEEKEKNIADRTTFICDDGEHFIKNTSEHFDILCVDLFTGSDVAPCVRSQAFLDACMRHTKQLVINVYTHKDILDEWEKNHPELEKQHTRYYASFLGIYGSPLVRS